MADCVKGKPLPLSPGAKACVRCGFCCKQAACPFGEWDTTANQCKYLKYESRGMYTCLRYDEILQQNHYFSPSFGAGCCSGLSPARLARDKQIHDDALKEIESLRRVILRQDEIIMLREERISELTLKLEKLIQEKTDGQERKEG